MLLLSEGTIRQPSFCTLEEVFVFLGTSWDIEDDMALHDKWLNAETDPGRAIARYGDRAPSKPSRRVAIYVHGFALDRLCVVLRLQGSTCPKLPGQKSESNPEHPFPP